MLASNHAASPIAQQREGQPLLLGEGCVGFGLVPTEPDDLSSSLLEHLIVIPESACIQDKGQCQTTSQLLMHMAGRKQGDGAAEASPEAGAGLTDEALRLLADRGGESGTHAQTSLVQPPVCAFG